MQRLHQHRKHSARLIAWSALLVMAALAGMLRSADANVIQQSVLKISPIEYTPTGTSDVTRILFKENYNGASLIQASSSLTITRTVNNKQVTISVPVAASASSQPGVGKTQPKPGFITFGTAGSNTFQPGDTLAISLTFQGNVAVSSSGGLWLNIDPKNNNPSTNGSFKFKSQAAVFDPSYTVSDNLDPSLFSDTLFTIENLAFLGNITTGQLDALDPNAIAAGILPIGATPASPSTFPLESSVLTSDPTLFSQGFIDPFPEPGPGLWDVAVGQFFDPNTDTLSGFIDAYQGVPEPSPFALLISGIVVLGSGGLLRRRGINAWRTIAKLLSKAWG